MRRVRLTRPIVIACAVAAVLGVVYAIQPTHGIGVLAYPVVLIAPGIALAGTVRKPRGARLLPALLTIGLAASALGDVAWLTAFYILGRDPIVSPADAIYLAGYLALCAALLIVTAVRHGDRMRVDLDAVIDVATIVVLSMLLFWNISVRGILTDSSLGELQRLIHAGYPVMDAVLIALTLRALVLRRTRTALGTPFAIGVCCWLLGDIGYLVVGYDKEISTLFDIVRTLGALLMATAAFRPKPAPAPEPGLELQPSAGSALRKLGIAIVPLLIPPCLLLLDNRDRQGDLPVVQAAVVMTVLALLTFARTARLLQSEKEVRIELAAARDEALEGSRAKSAFLATMSHEIRTPMNGVIGLTGLMLDTPLEARQRQYAEGVRSAGNALLAVINDVLDFSKIEAGHLDLEEIDLDLGTIVDDVAEMVAEPARAKELEVLAYCSPQLPVGLRGDPARLRQVLLNLAGNAVKFTTTGEVAVRAHLDSRTADGVVVRFEVVDTGIGIADEAVDRLFDPFSQADSSTTRQYGGTGLGLAISSQLVAAMGGEIGVDSKPGRGSTFWFTVPLALAASTSIPRRRAEPARGLRVLVVEDGEINQIVATGMLERLGYTVEIAADGLAGVAAVSRTTFDAVFMDVQMPGMNGFQATAEIRRHERDTRRTPIIAMTAGAADGDRAACIAAGMDDYLTKPIDLKSIESTLSRWVPVP